VAAVADAPDAPQCGDREICKLSIFSASSIRFSSWGNLLGFDLGAFLLRQLKCAHLVPAKAPLPDEAIFNQNQGAVEKRRAARKVQHKKRQITKRDRNDDRNKRRKVGEQGISSDEDLSPEPSWSGDVASPAVDYSNMSGSSSSSPLRGAEVSSSRRPREVGRDKVVGLSSCSAAPPARVGLRSTRSRTAPGGTGTPELPRSAPYQIDPPRRSEERSVSARQLYDGLDRPDSDSLQRHRSWGRSSDSASTPSAVPVAEPSAGPRRLQSLLIQGGGAPDVHVFLTAGGGHGPTPAVAEAGGTAPERMGENVAAIEAADRSREAPDTANSSRVVPKQGSKRGAPEQSMSDRSVKKTRVRSKM
jgi:hypothetical protein